MTTNKLLSLIKDELKNTKAKDVNIIDVDKKSGITSYFVLATATSTTQAKGIAKKLEDALSKQKEEPTHKEGYNEGSWIVLDYSDVIIHVMNEYEREFYDLDKIWGINPGYEILNR